MKRGKSQSIVMKGFSIWQKNLIKKAPLGCQPEGWAIPTLLAYSKKLICQKYMAHSLKLCQLKVISLIYNTRV